MRMGSSATPCLCACPSTLVTLLVRTTGAPCPMHGGIGLCIIGTCHRIRIIGLFDSNPVHAMFQEDTTGRAYLPHVGDFFGMRIFRGHTPPPPPPPFLLLTRLASVMVKTHKKACICSRLP